MGSFRFDDGDRPALVRRLRRALLVVAGALAVTLAHFLVLPLMQTIGRPPEADLILQPVDTADLPPPPPPEEEREEEPEQDATPQLTEAAPPLDRSGRDRVVLGKRRQRVGAADGNRPGIVDARGASFLVTSVERPREIGAGPARETRADRLRVGERDLAAEESRRERRHGEPKSLDGWFPKRDGLAFRG